MSEVAIDATGAFATHLAAWLEAQPQQRVAMAFVNPHQAPGHVALAVLEHELLGAAYAVREPQVAATKLNWWGEELGQARSGGGRHPLTRVLFADPRAGRIARERWLAPILAAMAQLEEGTATDFTAQWRTATTLHGALAELETAWWFGDDANPARARGLATLSHLLAALRRLPEDAEHGRLPLPMARLARFGLGRAQLREDGAAVIEAIRAQLDDLETARREAESASGPLSVFRAVTAQHDRRLLRAARRADQPLERLRRGVGTGPGITWAAWRAARSGHRGG